MKDIATIGKIKVSINTYKENCKQLTAGGTKKARQAWYELAIKDNLSVNMGDTIYYINTGDKKTTSDVQRVTNFFFTNKDGEKCYYFPDDNGNETFDKKGNVVNLKKRLEKEYNKLKKDKSDIIYVNGAKSAITLYEYAKKTYPKINIQEEDEIKFNCVRLQNEIVEDEEDHFCDDTFEYNRAKYINMFNKRIKPLLVCFDKNVRTTVNDKGKEVDNILIDNPKDRKTFTAEESKLVSGQPFNQKDQDTYEQLMTMEDKEIKFWISINKIPPYVKECGIDWDEVVADYKERQKQFENEAVKNEKEEYEKLIEGIKESDVEAFEEDGILPDALMKLIDFDETNNNFVSKKFGVVLGNIFDILDKDFSINRFDTEE